ncbi:MAG: flagellar motor protein MotA [Alphaproteobacteria bacterium]
MTLPRRYLVRMGLFLVAVAIAVGLLYPTLLDAFRANVALNGMILAVLFIGILFSFRQVTLLWPEVTWIETYRRDRQLLSQLRPPRLLAPMAAMLGERKGDLRLSTIAMRSLLDGIGSRLDEARDIERYMIGLLIFLGLLGTFWGLLQTVNSVAGVIASLSIGSGDMAAAFDDLKSGLQAPLGGMGTAFSSSLFGLGGSLVLGFLELQAGQAQNRFYNDLEDWLSSVTRLSAGAVGEGDQAVPAYIQALLEQTAESLETLQRTLSQGEDSRAGTNENVLALTERLGTMTEQMSGEIRLLSRTIAALAEKEKN